MNPEPFEGFTRYLGKPNDWRPQFGTCRELAIRDDESIIPGIHTMVSVWVPTEAEREAISAGRNIQLIVCGHSHPAIAMRTTDLKVI